MWGDFFGAGLQLLFIGLKLTGYITWSWWCVFLPTLIPLGIVIVLSCVFWSKEIFFNK